MNIQIVFKIQDKINRIVPETEKTTPMGWSCQQCTEYHPEDHLQCGCGFTRNGTDYATAVSVATAVANNTGIKI